MKFAKLFESFKPEGVLDRVLTKEGLGKTSNLVRAGLRVEKKNSTHPLQHSAFHYHVTFLWSRTTSIRRAWFHTCDTHKPFQKSLQWEKIKKKNLYSTTICTFHSPACILEVNLTFPPRQKWKRTAGDMEWLTNRGAFKKKGGEVRGDEYRWLPEARVVLVSAAGMRKIFYLHYEMHTTIQLVVDPCTIDMYILIHTYVCTEQVVIE